MEDYRTYKDVFKDLEKVYKDLGHLLYEIQRMIRKQEKKE